MARRFEQAILAGEVAVIGPGTVGSIPFTAPGPDSSENKERQDEGPDRIQSYRHRKASEQWGRRGGDDQHRVYISRGVSPHGLGLAAPQSYVIVDAINPEGWIWVLPDRVSLIERMLSDTLPGAAPSQVGYEVQGFASDWAKGRVFVDARVYPPKVYVDDVEMVQVHFGPKDRIMASTTPGWSPPARARD
ncbi:hypothetical protein BO82DRAFT_408442 [Aspergillus uvarum CBS 121591]|uniref:Uncharacterized protein n=1 Tax=Aspergillus uvarum CBS 121591 TaxID=1448315 RepID=A0A319D8D3_9EURO|nr:hypothetical protein BO82DRAFT_408442 [Aspergillus uvarum CBS 121591]PYH87253.1 hypothetical protein BO82DRAFT_408442 [Aspergillus uvarum CBS 121591]